MKHTCLTILFLLLVAGNIFGQNKIIDSLKLVLSKQQPGIKKVNCLNDIGWEIMNYNPDTAIILSKQALAISKKLNLVKGIRDSYAQLGTYYRIIGDYTKSLSHLLQALKIDEELKDEEGMAIRYSRIAIVYENIDNFKAALNYYFKALKIDIKTGDPNNIASDYCGIGTVYDELNKYDTSLHYYNKALTLVQKCGNIEFEANCLANIGIVHAKQQKYEKALECYLKCQKISEQIGDKYRYAADLGNIGSIYLEMKQYGKAEDYLKRALLIFSELRILEGQKQQHLNLSTLYQEIGKHKLSLEHFKQFVIYKDSVTNEENTKKQTQLEMRYEFDKTQTADSIKNIERAKQEFLKHQQEIKQQKLYTFGGIIGFGLMLIVAFVSFRAFRNKQKANLIIVEQKLLVEEKQKEVLDSIHYAKRIQQALLPPHKYIQRVLKQMNS